MRPTIRIGSTGAHVGVLQRILGVAVDEQFGQATKRALVTWQKGHGLHADGICGPQTWTMMGEMPAPSTVTGASPACRAALRDANARWPNRKKASDGIMGDTRHQAAGTSSHNRGDAVDISHDPDNGCDCGEIVMLARRDQRTSYTIFRSRIWNRAIDPIDGPGRPYKGSNPHKHHCHISIHAAARNDASPWPWATH